MAKKKDTTVYTHISETVNNVTGEVVSTKKDEVIRREKTPQFIMLFTEGAPDLVKANLTKAQSHVLWKILEKYTHTQHHSQNITQFRDESSRIRQYAQ